VEKDRTELLGKNQQRILEGHIKANGHDLVIVVSHWTSRVSDEEGEKRVVDAMVSGYPRFFIHLSIQKVRPNYSMCYLSTHKPT